MQKKVYFFSSGVKIAGILGYPDVIKKNEKYPGIVINHGYSGNKEEYNEMAEVLNLNGYVTLQFDSRGCGETEAVKGRMMCSTEWIDDADSAITYLTTIECVDENRIGFTGCSMGGAITIVKSANDSRIKCSVAMAPLGDGEDQMLTGWLQRKGRESWESFLEDMEKDNKERVMNNTSRFVTVPYALCMIPQDEEEFLASRKLEPGLVRDVPLESVRNGLLQFKPIEYCHKIKVPIMYIHGDADFIVPLEQSRRMFEETSSKKELIILKGAPHPLPISNFKKVVFEHAIRWFNENL